MTSYSIVASPTDRSYVSDALLILRDAGADINRIDASTSLTEALQLIAATAVRLVNAAEGDNVRAVIYTYDAATGQFDPDSRVSAGEGEAPLFGDVPRSNGVGATSLLRRSRVLSYEENSIPLHPLKYQAGIRSAACYPLLVVGQPVGALYIDLRSARRFTDDELLVLDTFVQSAAVAIYNTRQFEGINRALQRKVDELEKLQRAEQLISSRLRLEDTLHEILATALELIHVEHGSFRLIDKRHHLLKMRATIGAGKNDEPEHGLPLDETSGIMGWVARHRRPARIGDLHQPPWADIYRPLDPDRDMRSELAVPLLGSGGGLEGVLNVESPRLEAFTTEHQQVLEALATQAVIAIQEAKLLDTIEEVSAHLIDHAPDDLFAVLIERACDLLNVDHAAIWEIERSAPDALVRRAATDAIPQRYSVPLEGSLLGRAVSTRQPVSSVDLTADPRVVRPELVQRMQLVSALIVPLITRDHTPHGGVARGAFGVYTLAPRTFSDWDTRLLTSLANHAAIALQQAEALEQLKAAQERQAVAETFAVLGDVAANLLHRVNNLIGVIPVRVQGVLDKRPALQDDAYVDHALHEIEDSARATMAAARESMGYLRPLRLQPTSIETCYRTACSRVSVPANIELSSDGLDALPPVMAGEEQLRLVLFNLIENAIDAIGDRAGHIAVSGRMIADPIEPQRHWIDLAISDDGPGVPEAVRDRIFDSDFSTKRSAKKLGFGLWWTKSLVQRFGGSINVTNNLDAGCTFNVHLPPAEEQA